jgi:fibronectin type 3 domain-containing protein
MRIIAIYIFTLILICCNLNADWISLDTFAGFIETDETDSVEVIFNTSGLTVGTYTCSIRVQDNRRIETFIPVTLYVESAPPQTPANLTISIENNNVILNWDSIPEAESYYIYRSIDPFNGFIQIGYSDLSSYNDVNAGSEKKYYYYVTSYNTRVAKTKVKLPKNK